MTGTLIHKNTRRRQRHSVVFRRSFENDLTLYFYYCRKKLIVVSTALPQRTDVPANCKIAPKIDLYFNDGVLITAAECKGGFSSSARIYTDVSGIAYDFNSRYTEYQFNMQHITISLRNKDSVLYYNTTAGGYSSTKGAPETVLLAGIFCLCCQIKNLSIML